MPVPDGKPRYRPRKVGGKWRVYDYVRFSFPHILGGLDVIQDVPTEEEAQAEADRLNRGTDG